MTTPTNLLRRLVEHPPHKEGSREHVIAYHGGYRSGEWIAWRSCSEPRCEINEKRP